MLFFTLSFCCALRAIVIFHSLSLLYFQRTQYALPLYTFFKALILEATENRKCWLYNTSKHIVFSQTEKKKRKKERKKREKNGKKKKKKTEEKKRKKKRVSIFYIIPYSRFSSWNLSLGQSMLIKFRNVYGEEMLHFGKSVRASLAR